MDDNKIFPGFTSYGGGGYVFCGPTPAPATDAASQTSAPAAAPAASHVPVLEPRYQIEVQTPQISYHGIKKEQHELSTAQLPPPQFQPPHPTRCLPCLPQDASRVSLAPPLYADSKPAAPAPTSAPAPAPAHYVTQVVQDVSITYVDQSSGTKDKSKARVQYPEVVAKRGRRRGAVADPASWVGNVRKLKHQRGEAYVSRRGKVVPPRAVRTFKDCMQSCKLHCSQLLNETDRQHIFRAFYSLSANEKKHFLLNTTERVRTKRPTKMARNDEPKRRYSFKYFFLVRAVRYNVCKSFYLGTLAISQKPVYNVHEFKSDMNIPKPDGRGHSQASAHAVPAELKDGVRKHIMSYPVAETSGARGGRRQYLGGDLSVKRMYRAYAELCAHEGRPAVKESMYRKIFSADFNLHFKKRKPERCDSCKTLLKGK